MVRLGSLALVGKLPRDGISIETLVVVQPYVQCPYLMSAMPNQIYSNNLNGAGTKSSKGLLSGKGSVYERVDISRQSDTVNSE